MSDRLQEIRARLDAATPWPWRVADRVEDGTKDYHDVIACDKPDYTTFIGEVYSIASEVENGTARFIAHAPADIAWCLAEIEARDERIALLRAEVSDLEGPRP